MPKPTIHDLPAKLMAETDRAYQLEVDKGKHEWFPKSQVEFDGSTLTCPEWLLVEKGLEYLL